MALRLAISPTATATATAAAAAHFSPPNNSSFELQIQRRSRHTRRSLRIRVSDGRESYLGMWKNAVERYRKTIEFQKVVDNTIGNADRDGDGDSDDRIADQLEKKSEEFSKILQVPREERDRVQRIQVVHRAAAAIAAARALVGKSGLAAGDESSAVESDIRRNNGGLLDQDLNEIQRDNNLLPDSGTSQTGMPGPDFWSWTPPPDNDGNDNNSSELRPAEKSQAYPMLSNFVEEKVPPMDFLSIPFESNLKPLLPPFQSSVDVEKLEASESSTETHSLEEDKNVGIQFLVHAAEASQALGSGDKESMEGIYSDGSRWWKETGVEHRPDGVICKWTLTKGVSADLVTEWQNKYWEAADEFGYKELGSEKSGRDSYGNVWREYWRESMRQEEGVMHLEKTADKWGKNESGTEWQEKWWEHYGGSGLAEKNAHKWCRIDPNTYIDPGHAHIWHERWGEKYDGKGGCIKYTDKWAERCEGDGWSKWGDKWDENFGPNGHGVKQGETWWEGKHGEQWNRTWGEGHNDSGWVHKYGKSSSGEHWDTHVQQETWYERFPHFGFYHCFNNSVQLREVQKPSETSRKSFLSF